MTNGDKIRSMTDKELAEWLDEHDDQEDIKKFDSIHDAFSFLNCTVCGAISRCCHGRKKSYKGYKWRFAND